MTDPLESYSGSIAIRPDEQEAPASVAELLDVLANRELPRPITLRATGNSLHDQALGHGTVILLDRLPHEVVVRPDDAMPSGPPRATVEVTAWTPWEAVVRAALRIEQPPARWSSGDDGHWDVGGHGGTVSPDARNVCRRAQICDVKAIPKGRALLSSNPDGPAIAVTVAVEDGVDYGRNGWGDPKAAFRALSRELWAAHGVRVHLTKNLHAEPEDLAAMYGGATERLRALRADIDPAAIFGSSFLDSTLPSPP